MGYDDWKLATPPEYDELGPEPIHEEEPPQTMLIKNRSKLTGKEHTLEIAITPEQLERWLGGELIQNVCPHLSADDREFLISGATKEEWEHFFGKRDKT